ncbi:MAG: hypothetical protein JNL92_23685 [Opitutaceae bacterium]|nr:hypothetical protein [Opitutaceae bacterium]
MSGGLDQSAVFAALPPVWPEDLLASIRHFPSLASRKLVVLDDDPTGTQTVHDVPVVTTWDTATLAAELSDPAPCCYVLTNSRSLAPDAAGALNRELATHLRDASARTRRGFTLVSRSDSTLRGHFPVETDALAAVTGPYDATIVFPYFEAGGRYTIHDQHYVAEAGRLVPAADTPFARDAAFGYRHSDLRDWVEEKTGGRIRAAAVTSLSLDVLRRGGPSAVATQLLGLAPGSVCVVNAAAPQDAAVFALASLVAEAGGRRFLYRTAASFVAARLGLAPRPLLGAGDFAAQGDTGGLIVAGSHVPKTTAQLAALRATHPVHVVELPVERILADGPDAQVVLAAAAIDDALARGRDVLLATSRTLVTGADAAASLEIGRRVSETLISIVRRLQVRPRFLIAKGGITSSDVATRGLGVRRALVRGQLLPGVPVWRLGPEARFPGLDYVVFPGNVGGDTALADAVGKFSAPLAT